MIRHILPNVTGPGAGDRDHQPGASAIITEATLSFLGVGVPPDQPSLGTLIRIGNDFLFSGEWWITIFPGVALVVLVLAVNLLGDWLRDALNPKLRCAVMRDPDERFSKSSRLLTVEFPTRRGERGGPAVDDIFLSNWIEEGEVLGVVGESGAGKSTHRQLPSSVCWSRLGRIAEPARSIG